MAWNAEILFLVLMSMLWIYFYSRMVPSFARPRQLNEFRRNTSIKDIENGHTIS
jgi:hypothetical protein